MVKVITYGTFDVLHYGHIRLLERAKALGDYLIVGITADDFDKQRGKINVQQTLMERIEAVRSTGIADDIIVEEYEGQKIDDIKRFDIDIFAIGSDWKGKFDYLNDYCKVIYLDRTQGVSSSDLRTEENKLRFGLIGEGNILEKYFQESIFVNGIEVSSLYTSDDNILNTYKDNLYFADKLDSLFERVDAVYIVSHPAKHYEQIKAALIAGKHVLCESPIALTEEKCKELFQLADLNGLILMEAIKTAYSTAYNRLLLLLKSGCIGNILSVDATCTSLTEINLNDGEGISKKWNSLCAWGPTAMLPIFQILGTDWNTFNISSLVLDQSKKFDLFTRVDFVYKDAVASMKVGNGVKSEGDLIVSGTKGYIYVPAPWWKTDYFEIRYENASNNRRYFYQLDGEGIRYELVAFLRSIKMKKNGTYIEQNITQSISKVISEFESGTNVTYLINNFKG